MTERPRSARLVGDPDRAGAARARRLRGGIYCLRVAGRLEDRWSSWFDGFVLSAEEDGSTRLTGAVADQAALHGLLARVRDLGLDLISLNRESD